MMQQNPSFQDKTPEPGGHHASSHVAHLKKNRKTRNNVKQDHTSDIANALRLCLNHWRLVVKFSPRTSRDEKKASRQKLAKEATKYTAGERRMAQIPLL